MQPGVSVLYNGGKEDYREISVSASVQPRFKRPTEHGFTQNCVSGEGMIRGVVNTSSKIQGLKKIPTQVHGIQRNTEEYSLSCKCIRAQGRSGAVDEPLNGFSDNDNSETCSIFFFFFEKFFSWTGQRLCFKNVIRR